MFLFELQQIEARERGREANHRRLGQGLPPHPSEKPFYGWAGNICPKCKHVCPSSPSSPSCPSRES